MKIGDMQLETIKAIVEAICDGELDVNAKILFIAGITAGMYAADRKVLDEIDRVIAACTDEELAGIKGIKDFNN